MSGILCFIRNPILSLEWDKERLIEEYFFVFLTPASMEPPVRIELTTPGLQAQMLIVQDLLLLGRMVGTSNEGDGFVCGTRTSGLIGSGSSVKTICESFFILLNVNHR